MNYSRLTIIVDDSAVYTDIAVYIDLDLSNCGIPENVHALQWNEFQDGKGYIELKGPERHIEFTELPTWAYNCISVWEKTHTEAQIES